MNRAVAMSVVGVLIAACGSSAPAEPSAPGWPSTWASPHARARFKIIDTAAAKRRQGVVAVYTADDYGAYLAIAPGIIEALRLDRHDDLPHRDYLHVVEEALPLLERSRPRLGG